MIDIKNITFSYSERPLIRDFSLKIDDGTRIAISGNSGCGKSTLFRLITGLETPQSGEIVKPDKISVVFQEDRFVESISLKKNLQTVLNDEQYNNALVMLKTVGLEEFLNEKMIKFSGGMSRRAAIVRALAFNGDALLLDECFNGIDDKNKTVCTKLILEKFKDKPIIIISHSDEDISLLGAEKITMIRAK